MATRRHSRDLRPSPVHAHPRNNPLGARPRSRSLPIPPSDPKKRLRRPTLASTSNISRILFDCKNKENTLPPDQTKEVEDKLEECPQKSSRQIAVEVKTPDFHSSSTPTETPQFPALPPSENKCQVETCAENDCEILLTKRFDVLLPFAGPPTRFVGVDIDETLVMTNHAPSILLTTAGVTAFQRFVHQKFSDFKTKNALCRELEKAIKDKVLVESNIPAVIRDLQDSGCWVFGVTARYHEMAASTEKCLNSLGINLSLTSPFPPQLLRDPKTGAVCTNGIIYCNGLSKGNILNRFFENVVLRNVLASKTQDQSSTVDVKVQSANSTPIVSPLKKKRKERKRKESKKSGLPERFIFIDDQRSQAECIAKDLECARTLNIPVTCFHYVPDILRDPCEKMDKRQRGQILLKQMLYFIEKKIVLSNQDALQMIKMSCMEQQQQHQPQHQPQPQQQQPQQPHQVQRQLPQPRLFPPSSSNGVNSSSCTTQIPARTNITKTQGASAQTKFQAPR